MGGAAKGRSALITGLSGQDGSFLAELLLQHGYAVTGLIRDERADLGCAEHLRGEVATIGCELADRESLARAVAELRPDELYHLAAPSFVPRSWQQPAQTFTEIAVATAALLEAVRESSPHTRTFLASSAAIFGAAPESPQREQTPCFPASPYAAAKLAVRQLGAQLRCHDGLYISCGILYNHESERRPESFVTRKITKAAAAIKAGLADQVTLGDLDAVRDWSFAGDVMRGAWLALQADRPDDYIFASGSGRTVREFAEAAFAHLGLAAEEHIAIDESLRRAPEPVAPVGDPARARERLGWRPELSFEGLVARMVDADLRSLASRS
ncbi:MAG TPA: GDP-mannose 4,6-dehydratase [Solirubrobacteraceae bacterium]|nr:GDP-mannose 4,6-dehydratase [Solirubrobacteraceae bacterium]